MHIHDLNGCAPVPLAHYLKALGILRLVAEQEDPSARGWWEGERFRLMTRLSRDELEKFFLERYEPTPMFNPWGGRSGYYSGSSEKSARDALQAIEQSHSSRLENYRATVKTVRDILVSSFEGEKPKDDDRSKLILALRRSVRGKSTLWLDAVTSLVGAGEELDIEQPALFGTGGNEGSGSYTSAYMSAIEQCVLKRAWDHSLRTCLYGNDPQPRCDWSQSMGQFLPEGPATPWDLILALEGGCAIRSAVSSRNTVGGTKWMSSPFFVAPASYGYPSESWQDEYALKSGKELPGRGEQWFPLWAQPMLFSEVDHLFVEGRAATKRGRAADGWSMARAIMSRGVQQGIREFVRYGYQQRNNLATHFAVPLGRFRVPEQIDSNLSCLDDLDAWLSRLRREARDKHASARLRMVERRLSDALFAVAQHPNEPDRWQTVLLALADVEAVQVSGSGFQAGPVARLRPEWVYAADDGSREFRLALACGLQAAGFSKHCEPIDPVRRHWLPLVKGQVKGRYVTTGSGSQTRLQLEPGQVIKGRSGLADAIALVERRLIEAAQKGERRLPLVAAYRAAAAPSDLAALVAGELDLDRTLALARALMAIDPMQWANRPCPPRAAPSGAYPDDAYPDDAWLAIRLALQPWPLQDGRRIGADPAMFRRLAGGDAAAAVELALRRLAAAGIRTAVRVAAVSPAAARLWAAALAFPITRTTATAFLRHLDPNANPGEPA